MSLTPFVRVQLTLFALLTVVSLSLMALGIVKLPAMLGVGTIDVVAEMDAAAGIYEGGNVTVRGQTVGRIREVDLSPDAVRATLRIDSGADIPKDSTVFVRSVSAVGEQYVDFVPDDGASQSDVLGDGDVVRIDAQNQPVPVGPLLDDANALLASVPQEKLQGLLDESAQAFGGRGEDMRMILDSTTDLLDSAVENAPETFDLLRDGGTVLQSQVATGDAIQSWAADVNGFTARLNDIDPTVRSVLARAPETTAVATELFQRVRPTLPLLLANLSSVSDVLLTYNPGVEQLLVLLPPLEAAQTTVVGGGKDVGAANVDFLLKLNSPPACTTGYLPANERRSPNELETLDTPDDLYCKIPQNVDALTRGVRNFPCMEVPGRRAPTPEICRSPEGYVPLGNNPPVGDPNSLEPRPAPRVGTATYQPSSGTYTGPDGRSYAVEPMNNAAPGTEPTLGALMGAGR
ncbi:MAG: MlaD family protein [Rhodococcus sp. (in: high G+C Gram-positive bacteria)]